MQTQIEKDYTQAVIARSARLALSARRVGVLPENASMTLGETSRRTLLAAACPNLKLDGLSRDEIMREVETLFENAYVISATKRSAVISLGDVVCFAGMYGVVTFSLPLLNWPLSSTAFSRHSIIDGGLLLQKIGAFYDGRMGEDSLYNYSMCKHSSKGQLDA